MNNRILVKCSLAAIFAHATILPAQAGNDYSVFENIDGNADGFISKNEAQVREDLSKEWKNIDKDGDGQLDISEFSAFEGQGDLTPPQDPDMGEPGAAPYPDTSE